MLSCFAGYAHGNVLELIVGSVRLFFQAASDINTVCAHGGTYNFLCDPNACKCPKGQFVTHTPGYSVGCNAICKSCSNGHSTVTADNKIALLQQPGLSGVTDELINLAWDESRTVVFARSDNFQCIPCGYGNYKNGDVCAPCPAGEHNANPASNSCNNCVRGKYSEGGAITCSDCDIGQETDYWRSTSSTACHDCPVGKMEESGICTVCESGTYSVGKQTHCTTCEDGKYQPDTEKSTCIECPAGKQSNGREATSCAFCNAGKTVAKGTGSSPSHCSLAPQKLR